MLRHIAIASSILLLAGCVSESDVRAQVDQSAAALRQELAAARSESAARADKLAADLVAARTASEQRLGAVEQQQKAAQGDLATLRAELQAVAGDLGRTAQELQRRIDASSGVLRTHLQRQRSALADQMKALDQIIGGLDGAPAPAPAATAPAPAPAYTPVTPVPPAAAPAPR